MKKIILFAITFSVSHTVFSQAKNFAAHKQTSLCGPIPAVCIPAPHMGFGGIGISFVGLSQINNTSPIDSFTEDFTCTDSTWLDTGVAYFFEVHTGLTYEENVKAWIDFSNDGSYDPSELVYADSAVFTIHTGTVTIPTNAIHTFTPIRMRVGSDYAGNPPLTGCNNAMYGQYEDYTVYYGIGNGINETEKNISVTLSPNPFHTTATLEIKNRELKIRNCVMKIYNTLGALVRTVSLSFGEGRGEVFEINREDLPNGLYLYQLQSPAKVLCSGKFVVE
jgi:hypothetical protein